MQVSELNGFKLNSKYRNTLTYQTYRVIDLQQDNNGWSVTVEYDNGNVITHSRARKNIDKEIT